MNEKLHLKVFIATGESSCAECGEPLGRVGRSAAAKTLDERAVRLAVIAHVRHDKTSYDKLLAEGCDRHEARRQVEIQVRSVLAVWQRS